VDSSDRSTMQSMGLGAAFLLSLGLSYFAIGYASKIYSGIALVLFLLTPTVYGLLKVQNERVIVFLVSVLVADVLYFFLPYEL